jgi:hypothetical protein
LFESDIPFCLKCATIREAQFKKAKDIHATLVRDLTEATIRAESASLAFNSVCTNIPSFLPHPDGIQRIHNASHELTAARKERTKAHDRLSDFLNTGIVPEDLNQKG